MIDQVLNTVIVLLNAHIGTAEPDVMLGNLSMVDSAQAGSESNITDRVVVSVVNIQQLIESAIQKINLKVETPAWHVFIEIVQVGIVIHIFKLGDPFVMLCQHFSKGCFSGADITGYCHMFWFFTFRHNAPIP